MFITLGLGLPLLAFFHLVSHAYFKAILFMCAGSIIHRIKDYQDLRAMGNGSSRLPVSFRVFLVANLSLCGVPFLRGFFSKDLILEVLMMRDVNIFIFLVAIVSTLLTLIYSIRVSREVFFSSPKPEPMVNQREMGPTIFVGIGALLAPSILGGLGISWATLSFLSPIFLPSWLKLIVLGLILLSGLSVYTPPFNVKPVPFIQFMWFMPFIFS